MKHLVIIRHSNAVDFYDSDFEDFERPLKKKGYKNSEMMANIFAEKNIKADLLISSPAERAIETARVFAKVLGYNESEIIQKRLIYEDYTTQEFLDLLAEKGGVNDTILVFGHNPNLSYLANKLTGTFNSSFPKTAILGISFDINRWSDVKVHEGAIEYFEYPKKYK